MAPCPTCVVGHALMLLFRELRPRFAVEPRAGDTLAPRRPIEGKDLGGGVVDGQRPGHGIRPAVALDERAGDDAQVRHHHLGDAVEELAVGEPAVLVALDATGGVLPRHLRQETHERDELIAAVGGVQHETWYGSITFSWVWTQLHGVVSPASPMLLPSATISSAAGTSSNTS